MGRNWTVRFKFEKKIDLNEEMTLTTVSLPLEKRKVRVHCVLFLNIGIFGVLR